MSEAIEDRFGEHVKEADETLIHFAQSEFGSLGYFSSVHGIVHVHRQTCSRHIFLRLEFGFGGKLYYRWWDQNFSDDEIIRLAKMFVDDVATGKILTGSDKVKAV